ncbi:hypothetical protein [Synechococcus sp. LA31]|mgnify:CR=1 FL=1|jgi:hypothetical protein|uniref:hypothetical protein n=1 Tax=Synechococcus sp. LA31 TaxID=2741953 RepID=UPI001BDD6F8E|nr:hypothetical protein [Synechococcus sp. LA31]QVV69259.1 hypothetical protein KJJ24_11795 [Synechococcus sp. LA31]
MTATCFSTPLSVASGQARPMVRPRVRPRQLLIPAVVAFVFAAVLVAPEQPRAQAEICERYNGPAACRVW